MLLLKLNLGKKDKHLLSDMAISIIRPLWSGTPYIFYLEIKLSNLSQSYYHIFTSYPYTLIHTFTVYTLISQNTIICTYYSLFHFPAY